MAPAESIHALRMTVYAALMAALTAVGALIALPIGPVPIVLQNLFVMLAGLLLGARWGAASMGVYLLAGALGLPVFAGGSGGIGRLFGPTGGYLVGFLPAVLLMGFISARRHSHWLRDAAALACGSLVIYGFGVSWLKLMTHMTWRGALAVGMLPFVPGDVLKGIVALLAARALRPRLLPRIRP